MVPGSTSPLVRLDGVSLRFGRRTILDGIDLALNAAEVVGLIGPGGSGKTQLLKLMATLRHPQKGHVELLGRRMTRLNIRQLRETRRRIGLQFQNFALFDFLTVSENVSFSLEQGLGWAPEKATERAREILLQVDMAGTEGLYPSDLSGGMRRRVAIARVMAAQPDIAFFDDPVAGLDPVHSAKIMALLRDYAAAAGSLVVIATHDLERLFPVVSRVLGLFDGQLRFDGPKEALSHCPHAAVREFVLAATEPWQEVGTP